MIMARLTLVVCLFFTCFSFNLTFDQFMKSTPQTFGLITPTYNSQKDYTVIKLHIDRYATMECPEMEEIVIVWNNQEDPKDAGFKQLNQWKRPVYFLKTDHNSMDFRFSLPPESKAKVFFSLNDDIILTSSQLKEGFEQWKKNSVGDLGPLMGYGQISFHLDSGTNLWRTSQAINTNYYHITLVGLAWISRHYMELYNANTIWEIQQIRKLVNQMNNCDDIAMNYLVGAFYPQFPPIHLEGRAKIQKEINGQTIQQEEFFHGQGCMHQQISLDFRF